MVYINEWLPNPVGSDVQNEWVEIFNGGPTDVSLGGWVLKTKGGKKFAFKNYLIKANDYLLLKRPETGLVLKNTDEGLFLYNAAGKLIDESGFSGTAPEGRSFQRTFSDSASSGKPRFVFGEPTPGQPNKLAASRDYSANGVYPLDRPLNGSLNYFDVIALALGCAFLFSVSIIFLLKRNKYLQNLLFNGS